MQTGFGLPGWIWLIIIGLVAGWLASLIMRERRMGLLGYLIVGVIGCFLGDFIAKRIGFAPVGFPANLIAGVAGSIILIFVLRLIRR